MVTPAPVAHTPTRLTPNQIRGFWAAWGGWALDGMDASIYAVVLVPALTELLPRSGLAPTPANVGYYGSVLLALFLFGWGLSMVWGPVADRFGRVRALMLTILSYSLFTFLCALVTSIWQLAALRVLCGIGIGGEQPIGGTFVAEEWPEDRRKMGAGFMLDRPLRRMRDGIPRRRRHRVLQDARHSRGAHGSGVRPWIAAAAVRRGNARQDASGVSRASRAFRVSSRTG